MENMVGSIVLIRLCTFEIAMEVLKQKQAYGNDRLLVRPVGGSGEAWIDAKKVVKGGGDA